MKQVQFFRLTVVVSIFLCILNACKKADVDPNAPTDSIYGTYVKSAQSTGQWTDVFGGTIIKVRPGNPPYITIAVSGISGNETIFDSVKLAADKTFSINKLTPDPGGYSTTGFIPTTGTGSFGPKKMSMNFVTTYRENPLLYSRYVYENAVKTSDRY